MTNTPTTQTNPLYARTLVNEWDSAIAANVNIYALAEIGNAMRNMLVRSPYVQGEKG